MDLGDLLGNIDMDKVTKVVDWVTDNEELLGALAKLPDYLALVADGLQGAGEQARTAAVALVGDDGESGIRSALAESAEALGTIVKAVGAGADRIADAAESAAKVPLMDGPASRLADAAGELSNTTDKLADLGRAMEVISETLAKVGDALSSLGDHLVETSTSARSFADLT